MVKPSWVLFDVGAVLLDWPTSSKTAADMLNVDYDILLAELKTVAKDMNIGKLTNSDGWEQILKNLGKEANAQDIIDIWCQERFWNENTLKLLEELSAKTNTALFTNSWLGLREKIASGVLPDQLKLVSNIFDSSEIGFVKPQPKMYEFVEEQLQVSPENIFLIDDDMRNIGAAKARGWQTYFYRMAPDHGVNSNNELRRILSIL